MSTLIITNCGKLVAPMGVMDVTTANIAVTDESDGRATLTVTGGVTVTQRGDGILEVKRAGWTCAPTTTSTTTAAP